MKITDEMIESFGDAWQAAEGQNGEFPSGYRRRAGLEAVYPLIAAQVRSELAQSLRNMRTVDDGKPVQTFLNVADWLEKEDA